MNNKLLLTNIQRFSLHDGPGIRTTVFLKGCSIQCPWCCNPENLTFEKQSYIEDGENKVYGVYMTCGEIYEQVIKDKAFYRGNLDNFDISDAEDLSQLPGGVTFSGGEALLQMLPLEELLQKLQDQHVHTAIETSLFASLEQLEVALNYIDLFYVDIKLLDSKRCEEILRGSLDLYLGNLEALFTYKNQNGKSKAIVFRIPVIKGYTDTEENIENILQLLCKYKPIKVELIKGHNMGESKYISLGMDVPAYQEVPDNFMNEYAKMIEDEGFMVEVCEV